MGVGTFGFDMVVQDKKTGMQGKHHVVSNFNVFAFFVSNINVFSFFISNLDTNFFLFVVDT